MEHDLKTAAALTFLKANTTGCLATATERGQAHASPIHYIVDDAFNLYFLTLENSKKFEAIRENPKVGFSVHDEAQPRVLQLEGMAMEMTNAEDTTEKLGPIYAALNSNPNFFAPVTKLDAAPPVVIWIRPTWIRWADYTAEGGTKGVWHEIVL